MRKTFLSLLLVISTLSQSQKTDSLTWYKERARAYREKLENDSSFKMAKQGLLYEYDKREAALRAEMEEKELFYKERIDKLQTLLIAACASSAVVIISAFYMLNKKKVKDRAK